MIAPRFLLWPSCHLVRWTRQTVPLRLVCAALICVLGLAACGTGPTPIPDLTGTPRSPLAVPTYSEPAEAINRLNANRVAYLGRLDSAPGTPSSIISAAFAPNGTRLAVLDSKQIVLWDVISGRSLFAADHGGAQAVFYSADKTEVYTIRTDGVIVVYDDQGSERITLEGHEAYNSRFAYDAENGWLALGGSDGTIRIWDVAKREAKATLSAHTDEVMLLAFSADGKYLVSVGYDQQIIWWDWATRTKLWSSPVGDRVPVRLAISQDNSQIAVATDVQILVFNSADGAQKASLPLPTSGAEDVLVYTPDSKFLIAASRKAPMTMWNAQTGQLIGQFPDAQGNRVSTTFSPNGELMLMAVLDKSITLWDLTQASEKGIPRLDLQAPTTHIVGVQWSADGYLIALLGAQGEIYVMGIPQQS